MKHRYWMEEYAKLHALPPTLPIIITTQIKSAADIIITADDIRKSKDFLKGADWVFSITRSSPLHEERKQKIENLFKDETDIPN